MWQEGLATLDSRVKHEQLSHMGHYSKQTDKIRSYCLLRPMQSKDCQDFHQAAETNNSPLLQKDSTKKLLFNRSHMHWVADGSFRTRYFLQK